MQGTVVGLVAVEVLKLLALRDAITLPLLVTARANLNQLPAYSQIHDED